MFLLCSVIGRRTCHPPVGGWTVDLSSAHWRMEKGTLIQSYLKMSSQTFPFFELNQNKYLPWTKSLLFNRSDVTIFDTLFAAALLQCDFWSI